MNETKLTKEQRAYVCECIKSFKSLNELGKNLATFFTKGERAGKTLAFMLNTAKSFDEAIKEVSEITKLNMKKQHKTNQEIAEKNSNIPYPKIMKYKLKNFKQYGTFKRCEILSSDCSEMDVYSPNGKVHVYPQFTEDQVRNTNLFEPVKDRIKRSWNTTNFHDLGGKRIVFYATVDPKTDKSKIKAMNKLIEQAINGELFPREAVLEITNIFIEYIQKSVASASFLADGKNYSELLDDVHEELNKTARGVTICLK